MKILRALMKVFLGYWLVEYVLGCGWLILVDRLLASLFVSPCIQNASLIVLAAVYPCMFLNEDSLRRVVAVVPFEESARLRAAAAAFESFRIGCLAALTKEAGILLILLHKVVLEKRILQIQIEAVKRTILTHYISSFAVSLVALEALILAGQAVDVVLIGGGLATVLLVVSVEIKGGLRLCSDFVEAGAFHDGFGATF